MPRFIYNRGQSPSLQRIRLDCNAAIRTDHEIYRRPKEHFWAGIGHVWSTTSPNLTVKFALPASCATQNCLLAATRIHVARLQSIKGVGKACPVCAIWKQFCGGNA